MVHNAIGAKGPRKVVVVAFDGVRFLDVVGPLEVFTVANEQGDHYKARVATLSGHDVLTTTGNRLGADVALEDLGTGDIDTLLVAGTPNWGLLLAPDLVAQVPAHRLRVHGDLCAGRRRSARRPAGRHPLAPCCGPG
jgi:transcriptional regulator GlxA family with amidase domain